MKTISPTTYARAMATMRLYFEGKRDEAAYEKAHAIKTAYLEQLKERTTAAGVAFLKANPEATK